MSDATGRTSLPELDRRGRAPAVNLVTHETRHRGGMHVVGLRGVVKTMTRW